jgi:hypothetical protein
MKKWLIPACIVGVLIMGCAAVLQKERNKFIVNNENHSLFAVLWEGKADVQPSGKTVSIPLAPSVTQLDNRMNSNISQFCNATPSIEIDSALLAELDQDLLKQGIIGSKRSLVLSQQMPKIVFNTAKGIRTVSNYGTGNLTINCPDRELFTLRNFGIGNITVAESYLKNVEVQNMGTGNINVDVHNVDQVSVDTKGTGSVSFNNVSSATVSLYGVGNVNFANTPTITSTVKGLGSINTNVSPSAERAR